MEPVHLHLTVTIHRSATDPIEHWYVFSYFTPVGFTARERQLLRYKGAQPSWELWLTGTEIRRAIASGAIPNYGMTLTGHRNGHNGPEARHTILPSSVERFAEMMQVLFALTTQLALQPGKSTRLYRETINTTWSTALPKPSPPPPQFRRPRRRRHS